MGIIEKLDERLERIEVLLNQLADRPKAAAATVEEWPEYLDTVAAAALIGVSKQSMALWRSKGTGPAYAKVGGTVRYSRDALRTWMRENER